MNFNDVEARTKRIGAGNGAGLLLDANPYRLGVMIYNDTSAVLHVALDNDREADARFWAYAVGQHTQDTTLVDLPHVWQGRITYYLGDVAESGAIHVTEFFSRNRS